MSDDVGLNSTETGQEAIIGHCVANSDFFKQCSTKLKAEWFTANVRLSTLFNQLIAANRKYNEPINNVEEFKNLQYFRELDPKERDLFYSLIDRCLYSSTLHSLEKTRKDLTGFLRMSLYKTAMQKGSKMYNGGKNVEDAYEYTRKAMVDMQEASFENGNIVNKFGNILDWMDKRAETKDSAISTGNALLDQALGGGLFPQDNSAILAPSNVGKSTALITVARHAVQQQKKVLFLTHEDVPDKIKEKVLLSMLGISRNTLFTQWRHSEEKQQIIKMVGTWLDRYLYFIPFNKAGAMFVEDVIGAARELHNDLLNKSGHGFDLIIDDYPKKLKMKSRMGSKESLFRAELAEVYDHFVQLAIELNTHCMYAIQTNREGLKMNNRKDGSDTMLGMEQTDEAFGIAQNTANIIAIMRSPEDKHKNIMRINVAKNRNGLTDIAVVTRTAFHASLVFGDKDMFKGVWANDLPQGFLASFAQSDAKMISTDIVDIQLKDVESRAIVKPGTVGEYMGVKNEK